MTHNDIYSGVANGLQYIAAALQSDQIFQIIQLVLSIATTLIIAILKIISLIKAAKQDGKITNDEIGGIIDEAKNATQSIADDVDNIKKTIGKDDNDNG